MKNQIKLGEQELKQRKAEALAKQQAKAIAD